MESVKKIIEKVRESHRRDFRATLVFYKKLSDLLEEFTAKEKRDISELVESDRDLANYYKEKLGYFIPKKHLFSEWIRLGSDFDVACVAGAEFSFARNHTKEFGITITPLISKLFGEEMSERTERIGQMIRDIHEKGE